MTPTLTPAARKSTAAGTAVLIVEDEPDIAELIRFHVDREGYDARVVASGRDALDRIERTPPDLVLLDLMLPDLDGLEVCRRLKWNETTREIPIVIVSARGEEADIVTGLELGAVDYVTKPFSPRVLVARLRNVLRRRSAEAAEGDERDRVTIADGRLVIDLDRHVVTRDDEPCALTRTEFDILVYLARRPGFVRTRDQIISAVHGHGAVLSSRTVDVHVTAIRRKLGPLGGVITTVRGVGYRLTDLSDGAS
jgi:two-component system phosphate regulon response regulator PhoB